MVASVAGSVAVAHGRLFVGVHNLLDRVTIDGVWLARLAVGRRSTLAHRLEGAATDVFDFLDLARFALLCGRMMCEYDV